MTASFETPRQQQQLESQPQIAYKYLWSCLFCSLFCRTCGVACFVGHSKQISIYATKTRGSGKYWAVSLHKSFFDKLLVAYAMQW